MGNVKGGAFVYRGNGVVLSRVQNSGVSSSGVARTRVFEDGNPKAVGLTTDTPQLTYDIESWDLSTDVEALALGLSISGVTTGQQLDLRNCVPFDMTVPWRGTLNGTAIAGGMIVPSLYLDSAAYRFGVRQNAGETFAFRGDAQYIFAGAPMRQGWAKASTGPYTLDQTAVLYTENGASVYVLSVFWLDTDGSFQRLFHGLDYTDTANNFSLTAAAATAMPGTATLYATYFTGTAQTISTSPTATTATKPSAIRAKDIDVYLSDGAATPTLTRLDGVQSVECNWRVTRTADEELGNPHYVDQDFDIPDVTGNIVIRPKSVANLLSKISAMTGVSSAQVAGLLADTPLGMEIRISHPDTQARIKTLYIDDARMSVPPIASRANQVVDITVPFQSEAGDLVVIKGAR